MNASHPAQHALDLLHLLMGDVAEEPATESVLRDYYAALCRVRRAKRLPWLSVLRNFNVIVKLIYGPAYRKTYGRVYEGGHLRKRRVYRIPLLSEFEAALGSEASSSVTRVVLKDLKGRIHD